MDAIRVVVGFIVRFAVFGEKREHGWLGRDAGAPASQPGQVVAPTSTRHEKLITASDYNSLPQQMR